MINELKPLINKNDFPIFNSNKDLKYLDNAATTQRPKIVIESISNYYEKFNSNIHRGIYKLSEISTELYENSREIIAKYINASCKEIIFTSGTTMSINLLANYYFSNILNEDSIILLSELEHHSNIIPWQKLCEKIGCKIKYIKLIDNNKLNYEYILNELKTGKVKLISLSLMSNVLGITPDIKKIKEYILKYSNNTKLLLDAAQAIAHLKVDVKELDADFIVFSSHKIYGPFGVGIIWAKEELFNNDITFFTGGGIIEEVTKKKTLTTNSPHKFEAGTMPIADVIGFSNAINYINNIGIFNIINYEKELLNYLYLRLKEIKNINILNTSIKDCGPIISFYHSSIHSHDIAQLLDYSNIAIRAGHHCTQILHRDVFKINSSVRISLGIYNTKEDIDCLINALERIKL